MPDLSRSAGYMEAVAKERSLFIRVDPGEELIATLLDVVTLRNIQSAAIVSGVGMFSRLALGFFNLERDDYDVRVFTGILDVSSITGGLVRRHGAPAAHIHAVVNDDSHATYSGHVIDAVCHITAELFLVTDTPILERVKLPGYPATRIIAAPEGQNE
jgi:uncharacterized protein